MAVSGSVSTSKYDGRYYTVSWTATQSATNNTSTIAWTLKSVGGTSGWYAERTLKVVIAGSTVYSKTDRVERYAETIATGQKVINHDGSGNASFSISIEAAVYTSSVNCTGSSTFTLDNIPRASAITSASNITLGNACSIVWTPKSTSFYYKLKFSLNSWSYTTGALNPNTTAAYTYSSYTIPLDVANQIPNSTTGTMTVALYSYNSSACTTQIGSTSTKTFTVTVPSSVVPTISSASVTIDNSANSVIKGWGLYVAGYSKAKISASATGSYGSTISNFTISGGYSRTESGTSLSYTGAVFTSSGSKTFNVVAKDSRGRTSASKPAGTITVYAYAKPAMSSFSVSRSANDTTKMVVKANWTYASVNGKNATTATLKYKKASATSWTTYGTISKDTSTTLSGTFDEASSYNFQIVVTDSLSNSAEADATVSTVAVLLDFRAGGKGLGVGKIAESDALEVSLKSKFFNNIYLSDDYEFRSLDANGNSRSILKGISSEGNTILGYGNYTNADANTNIYGDAVQFFTNKGVYTRSNDLYVDNGKRIKISDTNGNYYDMFYMSTSNNLHVGRGMYDNKLGATYLYGQEIYFAAANANNASYVPYYRAGQYVKVSVDTAGYVTQDGTRVCFTIPLTKPVIGDPAVTVASTEGFKLRQNNKYTHGSGASTFVFPTSYEVHSVGDDGVHVQAVFENVTNVTNNDAIGIRFVGNVVFA